MPSQFFIGPSLASAHEVTIWLHDFVFLATLQCSFNRNFNATSSPSSPFIFILVQLTGVAGYNLAGCLLRFQCVVKISSSTDCGECRSLCSSTNFAPLSMEELYYNQRKGAFYRLKYRCSAFTFAFVSIAPKAVVVAMVIKFCSLTLTP
jgi:hypothetical protein